VSGPTNGFNLCIDNNEIMARQNGAVAPLFIQLDGGTTHIGGDLYLGVIGGGGGTDLCLNASGIVADCSSSERYKDHVGELPLGLEAVTKLHPVTFDWQDGQGHDLGFVAEEVAAVDPILATYRDGQVEGVKYKQLTAVLVNAIKEQQAQITAQEEEIAELNERLTAQSRLEQQERIARLEPENTRLRQLGAELQAYRAAMTEEVARLRCELRQVRAQLAGEAVPRRLALDH
jgi:hypothetical protein